MRSKKIKNNFFVIVGKPVFKIIKILLKNFGKLMLAFVFVFLIWTGFVFYKYIIAELPKIEGIDLMPPMSSKIVDRQGKLLYKFYKDENRTWVTIDKIPQSLIWATISVEDKEFYTHGGVSLKGVSRALVYNFTNKGGLRGGSTITQQLVKNVFLGNEKTWKRKIKEAILAVLVEWRLTKTQILERYFNQVSYGGDAYGVQEASMRYFGKDVWEINISEASFLAGLPAAPSIFSPYRDFEKARSRQKHVLAEMVKAGFINEKMAKDIFNKNIDIVNNPSTIIYPHFVFFVRDYVERELGFSEIERRGLTIVTTIDSQIQNMSEKVIKEEVNKLTGLKISNGASLIVDAKNGQILSMVGSKDYWSPDIDGKYNVTLALRQPGSAIKPINYSLALIRGKSLLSPIEDTPVVYKIDGQKDYVPKNYNGKYAGKVTLKQALASSLNIPSVKLLNENGVEEMIDLAQKMGISTWTDKNRFGLSLALGAGEVRMIDLAKAYLVFANLGEKIEINPIINIKDFDGNEVYSSTVSKEKVLDEKVAFLINEALSDDVARRLVFPPGSLLNISNKKVAVKTGTTNNLRDNWCIGWTPSYLVVSWVGNNDNSPMSWVASGISGATPIWNRLMSYMLSDKPNQVWEVPEGIVEKNICGKKEYVIGDKDSPISCFWTTPTPRIDN